MGESEQQGGTGHDTGNLQQIFISVKDAPAYPKGFRPARNGTKKLNIANKRLLEKLRQIEGSDWRKVYSDGADGDGRHVSLHYLQSASGKVFDVKVKLGWSNRR